MRVVRSPEQMALISSGLKAKRRHIGFVPTMGYLHEGHLSLIRRARKDNDIVVVSIFVNPIQFGPKEDYKKYPRALKRDVMLAEKSGCDIIFYPDASAMYPKGYSSYADVSGISSVMCGASRPGHFKGVCTVCMKLFNIVKPDIAYLGQKDYQQALIIKRMASDFNMGLKVRISPIVREETGLAMSSRNKYLSFKQKQDAAILYYSLKKAKALVRSGVRSSSKIAALIRKLILSKGSLKIDYIVIADPFTLEAKRTVGSKALIALAAYIGKTRLIDNVIV